MVDDSLDTEDPNSKYEYFIFTGTEGINFNESRNVLDPNGARKDDSDYDS
jgi:hypothetical protein